MIQLKLTDIVDNIPFQYTHVFSIYTGARNYFYSFLSVNYLSEESTIEDGSVMKLWTVNGRFIGDVTCEHIINCLEFSSAPEGISVNVIATGLSNGAIRSVERFAVRLIIDPLPLPPPFARTGGSVG